MASYEETQRHCETCDRPVLARRRTTNHVLQLLLTICTCGLWGFVWLTQMGPRFGGWRCSFCGGKV